MSDSILVRVTLGSYDVVRPSEKQTQVYVQIPEVARASWLLDASFYPLLKNEPWPHVIDEAHNDYVRRGVVSDSTSAAARQAIVDWLLLSEGADYDARYDAVQDAWEADEARRHPVARKLLEQNASLRVEVAELRAEVAALCEERHRTNEWADDAAKALRADRDRIVEVEAQRAKLAPLRQAALHDLPPGTRWRVIVTDSESLTGVAPVCTAERNADLHTIPDYPGGPTPDDEGVYDCCPWPQFDTYSEPVAAYLVALLNADAEAGEAS